MTAGESEARGRRLDAPHRRSRARREAAPTARRPSVRHLGTRLVERIAVTAYRLAAWTLRHVPETVGVAVLATAFQAAYVFWPQKRASSNANFAHVLGRPADDPAVRRLALAAYRTYARYLVELMRLPIGRDGGYADRVDLEGIEPVLERWRSSGRGLILTVGHLGSNEAVAAGIAHHGFPIGVVADDSAFPELFDLLRRQREAWGLSIIPWRNLRELFGFLRRNEILGLLVDWGYREDGIPVRLFGAWTCLPAGPAVLAAKTGTPIVPIAVRRDGRRFRVEAGAAIEVGSPAPAELQRATQSVADALERAIAAAPEQWYSFRTIWPATEAESEVLERRAVEMLAQPG
ncbi:MAG TPA: lysophospholipid acyltransferase family protein [Candidatus Limnocylindrales bacterium]